MHVVFLLVRTVAKSWAEAGKGVFHLLPAASEMGAPSPFLKHLLLWASKTLHLLCLYLTLQLLPGHLFPLNTGVPQGSLVLPFSLWFPSYIHSLDDLVWFYSFKYHLLTQLFSSSYLLSGPQP